MRVWTVALALVLYLSAASAAKLRTQARAKAKAEAKAQTEAKAAATTTAEAKAEVAAKAEASSEAQFISSMLPAPVSGRGRGRGRAGMYMGPEEFDESWWTPPPPVGPDPFLHGYSSRAYPRHPFGFGGMPNGGYGTAQHFWGGPSYHYPLNMPWWRGAGASTRLGQFAGSTATPYYTPGNAFKMGYGGAFPLASPYYYTPPPLQGDWNLPKNPPPPPGGAPQ